MNIESDDIRPVYPSPDRSPIRSRLRQLLAGNPFYILSAALLLFGVYRVSMDPRFDDREMQQLVFNFGSLQIYGMLLTLTALFLARRSIWYDSTLLVVLESSLVFVPFLLVSQAVSLSKEIAWLMCGLTGLLAAIKYSTLKMYFPRLNLPPTLLFFGAVVAIVNGELPLLFKSMQETGDAAMTLDMQEAAVRLALTGILPMLAVLAMLLPHSNQSSSLPPQKNWLPLMIYSLWITATGVHFYSIHYVYKTPFETGFFAPTVWVLSWLAACRIRNMLSPTAVRIRELLLALPALVTLPVVWPGRTELIGYLLFCNLAIYTVICYRERTNRVALHLVCLTLAAVAVEVMKAYLPWLTTGVGGAKWVMVCAAAYLILTAMTSRNPKLGLVGAVCAGLGTVLMLQGNKAVFPVALQISFAFALLHSISWNDYANTGAKAIRIVTAACWTLHSLSWTQSHSSISLVLPVAIAGALVIGYFTYSLLTNIWASRTVLYAAAAGFISTPAAFYFEKTKTVPPGILVVVGSFLLFAIGTWFALTKSKWFEEKPAGYGTPCEDERPPE